MCDDLEPLSEVENDYLDYLFNPTKEMLDGAVKQLRNMQYYIGQSYIKHGTVRAQVSIQLDTENTFETHFEFDPLDIGAEFYSVEDYLERLRNHIHNNVIIHFVLRYLMKEDSETPNHYAQFYPDLMKIWEEQ